MKLAVVAANGRAGKAIVAEAVARGLDVTAVARGVNDTVATKFLQKDIFDLTRADLEGFDVVVNAFGTFNPEAFALHTTVLEHLASVLSGTQTRLLVVGGAGSLYLDDSLTTQLFQTPTFPEAYYALAAAMAEGLAVLRTYKDLNWTYVSPAADFGADYPRTGKYVLAGEVFTTNANGESKISYADYAIAMVDEAVAANHNQARISVIGE